MTHLIVLSFFSPLQSAAIALFGVMTAKARGEKLPPNVAYDKHGNWTEDASETLDGGAIATFGGKPTFHTLAKSLLQVSLFLLISNRPIFFI